MTDPVRILLVEDNPADVVLALETFGELGSRTELATVPDGVAAIDYLLRCNEYADVSRPHLILLDLNLPGKDGREVLAQVKADENLRRIPILVLTSSETETDVQRCYDLGANCYLTKPIDYQSFQRLVETVETFWFRMAELPNNGFPDGDRRPEAFD